MRIAAYCRVSTDKEDQLNSLEAQKEFFAQYTRRTGDTLVGLYADEGISGTKVRNRREFLHMMADARRGSFDQVVVKDISRFARNTVDLLQNVRELKALGIETQFLTANMTSMGSSEFVLTIFGALAQEESANTSKRVKFGKKLNGEKGRVPNLVYGYDKQAGDYFHLTINPGEAAVVGQIFGWYTQEGCGAAQIAARLNERGVPTKRGCRWTQNAVCRILANRLYMGEVINGKEEVADFLTGRRRAREEEAWMVVKRPELAIISRELFIQAEAIRKERGRAFQVDRVRQSNKHLFSTLIQCTACGWSFRRMVRTYRNTYVRWGCSGHSGRGAACCGNGVTLEEGALTAAVQGYFVQVLEGEPGALTYARQLLARRYGERYGDEGREKEVRARLGRLQRERQRYVELYARELLSQAELEEKLAGLGREMGRLEEEEKTLSRGRLNPGALEALLKRLFPTGESLVDVAAMTNQQLKEVVEKIRVSPEGRAEICLRGETVPDCYHQTQGPIGAAPGL